MRFMVLSLVRSQEQLSFVFDANQESQAALMFPDFDNDDMVFDDEILIPEQVRSQLMALSAMNVAPPRFLSTQSMFDDECMLDFAANDESQLAYELVRDVWLFVHSPCFSHVRFAYRFRMRNSPTHQKHRQKAPRAPCRILPCVPKRRSTAVPRLSTRYRARAQRPSPFSTVSLCLMQPLSRPAMTRLISRSVYPMLRFSRHHRPRYRRVHSSLSTHPHSSSVVLLRHRRLQPRRLLR